MNKESENNMSLQFILKGNVFLYPSSLEDTFMSSLKVNFFFNQIKNLKEGDIFNLSSFVTGEKNPFHYISHSETLILSIKRQAFIDLLKKEGKSYVKVNYFINKCVFRSNFPI